MKPPALSIPLLVLAILVAGFLIYVWKIASPGRLTVVTWAGNYGQAQASAQITPYARLSRASVRIAQYDGGIKEIADQVAKKRYDWDVIDMELPDAAAACDKGLLEKLDPADLTPAPDGTPAAKDFFKVAIGPCWVGNVAYSRLIAFNPRFYRNDPPKNLNDFFDVTAYPGPRALPGGSAKYLIELALLADGVPPKAVYDVLSTPAGLMRAWRKLDSIKPAIIFSDRPAEMLAKGHAVFALVLNGDLFEAESTPVPLSPIWDGQLIGYDVLAIPRGNPKRALAMNYIRYATATKPLAELAGWLPYGPARKSARAGIGKNPALDKLLTPFQPTTGARMERALVVDEEWWRRHGAETDRQWQGWKR